MAASTTTSTSSGNRYCFDTGQFAEEAFDPAAFVTAAKEGASLEVSGRVPVGACKGVRGRLRLRVWLVD